MEDDKKVVEFKRSKRPEPPLTAEENGSIN
jgi:hypothetical protein